MKGREKLNESPQCNTCHMQKSNSFQKIHVFIKEKALEHCDSFIEATCSEELRRCHFSTAIIKAA